jgi:predicted phosphodiesterase
MQRVLIIPDPQIPYEDKRSFDAVEKYIAAHKWDVWLCLGDFLDFNALGKYVTGRPGAVKWQDDVARTFKAGNEVLDRHEALIRNGNPKARMILIQGNHDYRAVSYAEEHPGMKDQLDVAKNLNLKARKIEFVKSWENGKLVKIGNAHFLHGNYINKHHAAKMVDAYGVCVYYGHTHDVMFYPKMTKGNGLTLEAGSLGCLCRYDQAYMKGKPSNWIQAVTTMFVQPNGNFNLYTSKIFNHRFVAPDGALYEG